MTRLLFYLQYAAKNLRRSGQWAVFAVLCVAAVTVMSARAQASETGFRETVRIGRGAVLGAQWHPSGSMILVDTVTGVWLYSNTLQDVRHIPEARLARLSPDGTLIAGVDALNSVTLWDSATFTQTVALPGNTAYVTALEWNPDGSQIATLDRTGRVLVWDAVERRIQFEARLNGADQLAWSKGGSYLAGMNQETTVVKVWDQVGLSAFTSTPNSWLGEKTDIVWRSDTQVMRRIYSEIPTGQVWDVTTGDFLGSLNVGYASAYSPNGLMLGNTHIFSVSINDAMNNTNLFSIPVDYPVTIAWSPDSMRIAYGTWSPDVAIASRVYIVDVFSGQILHQFHQTDPTTKGIYWSADNQSLLIVDGANKLTVVTPSDSFLYSESSIAHTDIGEIADWASDGSKIAVANTNWGARVWDVTSGTEVALQMGIGRPASRVAWQPNGTFIAFKSGDWPRWRDEDKNIFIWDLVNHDSDGNPFAVIPNVDFPADIAWSPDGKTLAIVEQTHFIRLWSSEEPDTTRVIDLWAIRTVPFIDYSQLIRTIEWSSDSRVLSYSFSSSGNGGSVWLVDVQVGQILGGGSPHYGSDWAWTADNRLIWVRWDRYGDGKGPITLPNYTLEIGTGYDSKSETSSWERYAALDHLPQPIANAILSPKASKVIGFDVAGNAIIWDLAPQSLRAQLYGVNDAVWSPDETMVVVYGTDGVLRVVDSTSGTTLHTFADHVSEAYQRIGVFWSPDSRKLALVDRGALFIYERGGA